MFVRSGWHDQQKISTLRAAAAYHCPAFSGSIPASAGEFVADGGHGHAAAAETLFAGGAIAKGELLALGVFGRHAKLGGEVCAVDDGGGFEADTHVQKKAAGDVVVFLGMGERGEQQGAIARLPSQPAGDGPCRVDPDVVFRLGRVVEREVGECPDLIAVGGGDTELFQPGDGLQCRRKVSCRGTRSAIWGRISYYPSTAKACWQRPHSCAAKPLKESQSFGYEYSVALLVIATHVASSMRSWSSRLKAIA